MHITFTTDHTFSPNGVDIVRARKGDELELDDQRAQELVDRKVAKPKTATKPKPAQKPKAAKVDTSDKSDALGAKLEDKGGK